MTVTRIIDTANSCAPATDEGLVSTGNHVEEFLEGLDAVNIEWYITEQGHLFTRQWRLEAENFVPAEQVEPLQDGREPPAEVTQLEWLSRNLDSLRKKHPGQWAAIAEFGVSLVVAGTLPQLMEKIAEDKIQNPFITQIPSDNVVWDTTYASQVI